MRQKVRRKPKKNKIANELPKYDRINCNGRMIKRPLDREKNRVTEEIFPPVTQKEKIDNGELEDLQSFENSWEEAKGRGVVHDEFSAKSIAISLAVAASILAGAFFFAKSIIDIMNK
jgi:hypothetical protein